VNVHESVLSRKLVFWTSNCKHVIKYDLYIEFPRIFAHNVLLNSVVKISMMSTGCPLVMHCLTDLQSVHGFRCYDNTSRTRKVSDCLYSLYAWLLSVNAVVLWGAAVLALCGTWCPFNDRDVDDDKRWWFIAVRQMRALYLSRSRDNVVCRRENASPVGRIFVWKSKSEPKYLSKAYNKRICARYRVTAVCSRLQTL